MSTFEEAGAAQLLAAQGNAELARALFAGLRAALIALARVLAANHAARNNTFLPGG